MIRYCNTYSYSGVRYEIVHAIDLRKEFDGTERLNAVRVQSSTGRALVRTGPTKTDGRSCKLSRSKTVVLLLVVEADPTGAPIL
jgi:hypothetical protein